jgi:hypothetical protein
MSLTLLSYTYIYDQEYYNYGRSNDIAMDIICNIQRFSVMILLL